MLFTTLYRITKTSFISFWRNRWLSLAATLIMVLTLFIISVFSTLLTISNKTTESLRDKVDLIAYFNDSASDDQIAAIKNVIKNRSDVKSVISVSKDEALARWKERNKNDVAMRDVITSEENPLPRSLEIKTTDPEDLDMINNYLSSQEYKPLINSISYEKNKDLIDRLLRVTKVIKIAGWSLTCIFVLISILIIYNTIRLTIFARSEEIEIMKLVGGSDWYVRGPFIIEGFGYGVLGALISSILFFFIFKTTIPTVEKFLGLSSMNSDYIGMNIWFIILLQFCIGLLLGISCSVVAIKKYLD